MNAQSTYVEGMTSSGMFILHSVLVVCVGCRWIIWALGDFRLLGGASVGPGGGTLPYMAGRMPAATALQSVSLGFVRFCSGVGGEGLDNASACAMSRLPLASLLDKPGLPVDQHGAIRLFKP